MGTEKTIFEKDPEDLTIAHAWPEVTGRGLPVRNQMYVLRMRNQKLRNTP
jgi:hypothetical protein